MLKRRTNWILLAVVTGALAFASAGCGGGSGGGSGSGGGAATAPPLDESKLTTTASGLKYSVLTPGSGTEAKPGDSVKVHYTGWLQSSGEKFDSSLDQNRPFEFRLGASEVIAGWDEGVKGMKVGEKRELIVPPMLGYGQGGTPGGPIPPNATLRFQVELLEVAAGSAAGGHGPGDGHNH
jgi:FKBP-type peptidyl-prolyl cis-trans isomerase